MLRNCPCGTCQPCSRPTKSATCGVVERAGQAHRSVTRRRRRRRPALETKAGIGGAKLCRFTLPRRGAGGRVTVAGTYAQAINTADQFCMRLYRPEASFEQSPLTHLCSERMRVELADICEGSLSQAKPITASVSEFTLLKDPCPAAES